MTKSTGSEDTKLVPSRRSCIDVTLWAGWKLLTDSSCPHGLHDLFNLGALNKSIEVMTCHNAFEGGFFPDPEVNTTAAFSKWVAGVVPKV